MNWVSVTIEGREAGGRRKFVKIVRSVGDIVGVCEKGMLLMNGKRIDSYVINGDNYLAQ